jgi:hypothetical protein
MTTLCTRCRSSPSHMARPKQRQKSTKAAATTVTAPTQTPTTPSTIRWPSIKPKQLVPHELMRDQIVVMHDFLLPTEAMALLELAKRLPLTQTPPAKRDEAYRDNWRFSVEDPAYADQLWRAGLDRVCANLEGGGKPVGLNSNIRLYRYGPGERFGRHYDDAIWDAQGRRSEWTLLIYLNGDGEGQVSPGDAEKEGDYGYRWSGKELAAFAALPPLRGGQTVFYGPAKRQVTSVAPVAGMALLHRHGAHCLPHEAMQVLSGYKWVLRSDVMFA